MIHEMMKWILYFLVTGLIIGCGNRSMELPEEAGVGYLSSEEVETPIRDRKLIKTGTVRFETGSLDQTREKILFLVQDFDGYVSEDRSYNQTQKMGNELEIRIPSAKFESFLYQALKGIENFDERNINVSDITAEGQNLNPAKD